MSSIVKAALILGTAIIISTLIWVNRETPYDKCVKSMLAKDPWDRAHEPSIAAMACAKAAN